ncbi:MAG: type II methionyl aminopeptidase [Candidatus Micrarchaeaceae archaeon]
MEDAKEVGKVSYAALRFAREIIKEGASIRETAEKIENFIKEKGFDLAFPASISLNSIAAHDTPEAGDVRTFGKDVIKVDVGARKGDTLGDCAITIDLSGNYGKLTEAAEEALNAAISTVRAGASLRSIGAEVGKIAEAKGFRPIRNLGGHAIESGNLHARFFIPNFDNGDETKLEEGQTIAIEVFITDGAGYVEDSRYVQIFQLLEMPALRSRSSREIASYINSSYRTYPFALRWLTRKFESEFAVRSAINDLASHEALEEFPALVEKGKGIVAQAEKSMIVEKDSCTVLTE